MIQVLVVSDSHGDGRTLHTILKKHADAAVVIHLGDGAAEAMRFAAEEDRTWYIVRGNCDVTHDVPVQLTVSVGGVRLYLTHGYAERVKSGLLTLTYAAKEQEAAVALYGHTHIPSVDFHEGMMLLNPGSVMSTKTYAILEIERADVYPRMMALS